MLGNQGKRSVVCICLDTNQREKNSLGKEGDSGEEEGERGRGEGRKEGGKEGNSIETVKGVWEQIPRSIAKTPAFPSMVCGEFDPFSLGH